MNKYLPKIKQAIESIEGKGNTRYFVFGSSVRKEKFNDIDIGVVGVSQGGLSTLDIKEKLESTNIPYFIDVVDFDTASQSFTDYVFKNEPIVWIN
jgi:predicted nucleotidyltransferase